MTDQVLSSVNKYFFWVVNFLITFANVHAHVLLTIMRSNTTPQRQPLFLPKWFWKQAEIHDARNRFLQMKLPFQQNPLKQAREQHKVNSRFSLSDFVLSLNYRSKACWGILTVPGVRENINYSFVFCLITCTFTHAAIYKMLADQRVNRSYPGTDEIIRVSTGPFFLVIPKLQVLHQFRRSISSFFLCSSY